MGGSHLTKGSIYYMVQYLDLGDTPLVTSFEYKGTVDGKPDTHFFKAMGMSDTNIFLESKDLSSMVNLAQLKQLLSA